MGAKSFLVMALIAVATLLYLVYLGATYEPPEGTTTIVIPPPELQPVQAEPEPPQPIQRDPAPTRPPETASPAPELPEPEPAAVEEPVETIAPVELPSLNSSDGFITRGLQQVSNGAALLSHLADEQLIRRVVALVDNLSRNNLPQNNLPYRDVQGEFPVRAIDDNLFELDEAGFRRFDQVIDTLVAVDTGQAMALYRLARPLFQQAYSELGYADTNFDTTLRRAIRNVLETEDIDNSLQLVKPSVMYLYADSRIEGMSDLQKQMIRIGPQNQEKVKAKLRQILQAL